MKKNIKFLGFFLLLIIPLFSSCNGFSSSKDNQKDTIVIHDTVELSKVDTITFNIPCKVMQYNMSKRGKALLVIWLHGGITVTPQWCSMLDGEDYFTWPKADNYIADYLKASGEKAVFLLPICHHSEKHPCKRWDDCAPDLKKIIDDYIHNGIVDESRIYLTGSSDGGRGVWDLVQRYPHFFAAAMPLSIAPGGEIQDSTPIYWNTTRDEGDCTYLYNKYKQTNPNIQYCHHPNLKHGEDEIVLKDSIYRKEFFNNRRLR